MCHRGCQPQVMKYGSGGVWHAASGVSTYCKTVFMFRGHCMVFACDLGKLSWGLDETSVL